MPDDAESSPLRPDAQPLPPPPPPAARMDSAAADDETAPLSPAPATAPLRQTPPAAWYKNVEPEPSLEGAILVIPRAQPARILDFARRLYAFSGPGILIAIGYMDPGNFATGLSAGAGYGCVHLSVVLFASLIGIFLQALAARLGVAGKRDLAQACRDAFPRWAALMLWVSAELAMVATDLAEVIGFAVAFQLLTGLPTWAGVALSAGDTLLLLLLPAGGGRERAVELLSFILLVIIAACFAVQLAFAQPPAAAVLGGYLPSAALFKGEASLIAVGILGATVMPHNLYLHSAMMRLRAVGAGGAAAAAAAAADTAAPSVAAESPPALEHEQLSLRSEAGPAAPPASPGDALAAADTQQLLELSVWDSALSLSCAFAVNSAIVIVAAKAFHPAVESGSISLEEASSLSGAYRLLEPALGKASSTLFAVALLCSGQSSTFTGTMAGQVVMEGFLHLKLSPFIRRLLTRSVAIVPAALTAALVGDAGLNQLLVLSQVTLSFQLPFAIVPLVFFVSSSERLGPYAVSRTAAACGWVVCALIISLNLYMLSQV